MRAAGRRVLTLGCVVVAAGLAAGCRNQSTGTTGDAAAASAPAQSPHSDTAITTDVQAKFYTDDRLRGQNIDVATQNGAVTLRGTVPTDDAKEHAENLARSVDGVRSVTDQLTVADTTPQARQTTDHDRTATATSGRIADAVEASWITTKIQAQYFASPEVKPWHVDVTTSNGGVVSLEGSVDSAAAKEAALRIARSTDGVTRVEDHLRVSATTSATSGESSPAASGPTQPDAWLTSKIQAKYFLDDDVKGRLIDVDTRDGTVTLSGTVGSEAERRQAVAIARNTDGVRSVTDRLQVNAASEPRQGTDAQAPLPVPQPATAAPRPDSWMTMKIQSKYFLNEQLKGRSIDVDTRDGVVALSGKVQTAEEKAEAERIARETAGVKRVDNRITVSPAVASTGARL